MSHSVDSLSGGGLRLVNATIIDYATGGEQFSLQELGINELDGCFFELCTVNSLGTPLMPVLQGNKILLYTVSSGAIRQVPPTIALNAAIRALILHGQL